MTWWWKGTALSSRLHGAYVYNLEVALRSLHCYMQVATGDNTSNEPAAGGCTLWQSFIC